MKAPTVSMMPVRTTAMMALRAAELLKATATARPSPLPKCCPTTGVTPCAKPIAKTSPIMMMALAKDTPASWAAPRCPTMMLSASCTSTCPAWVIITGKATFRFRL